MLQCIAVRCSALQRVAVRCSALQCVAACCSALRHVAECITVCCSIAVTNGLGMCGNSRRCLRVFVLKFFQMFLVVFGVCIVLLFLCCWTEKGHAVCIWVCIVERGRGREEGRGQEREDFFAREIWRGKFVLYVYVRVVCVWSACVLCMCVCMCACASTCVRLYVCGIECV